MYEDPEQQDNAEQVFRRYADTLFRFCFTLTGNKADAEDAVSETMVRYITRAPVFTSEAHRKAWLLRVAANLCRDMHRFHMRHTCISLEDAYELCADEQQESILEDVMRLPHKLKTVIYLYYIEGYTTEEIADMLSISAAAVRKRLQYGRKKLKLELEENSSLHLERSTEL